jgi:hypothetical protein
VGVLDEAIRQHLELKRAHGASEDELERQEAEALGPARREPPLRPEREPDDDLGTEEPASPTGADALEQGRDLEEPSGGRGAAVEDAEPDQVTADEALDAAGSEPPRVFDVEELGPAGDDPSRAGPARPLPPVEDDEELAEVVELDAAAVEEEEEVLDAEEEAEEELADELAGGGGPPEAELAAEPAGPAETVAADEPASFEEDTMFRPPPAEPSAAEAETDEHELPDDAIGAGSAVEGPVVDELEEEEELLEEEEVLADEVELEEAGPPADEHVPADEDLDLEDELAAGTEDAPPDDPYPPASGAAPAEPAGEGGEDVLEETPEFLEEAPEHERLWFEQKPPRDFDLDN